MRILFLGLLSLSLVLQMQGAASLLGLCMNHWESCAIEASAASSCVCEHASEEVPAQSSPKSSPQSSPKSSPKSSPLGDCSAGCVTCHLVSQVTEDFIAFVPTVRLLDSYRAVSVEIRLSLSQWLAEPIPLLASIEAPPCPSPSKAWGVWRL